MLPDITDSVKPLPPLDCLRFFETAAWHQNFVRSAGQLGLQPPRQRLARNGEVCNLFE